MAGQKAQAVQKLTKTSKENESDPVAHARRIARREDRIKTGLEDLKLWLRDIVRQGVRSVQLKPQAYLEIPAARLVDAPAPGLAQGARDGLHPRLR